MNGQAVSMPSCFHTFSHFITDCVNPIQVSRWCIDALNRNLGRMGLSPQQRENYLQVLPRKNAARRPPARLVPFLRAEEKRDRIKVGRE